MENDYTKEIEKRCKAQAELCRRNDYPHFAPYNGICPSCRKQIYDVRDGTSHITGCPLCCQTYCD
jgi:hypothetical protein